MIKVHITRVQWGFWWVLLLIASRFGILEHFCVTWGCDRQISQITVKFLIGGVILFCKASSLGVLRASFQLENYILVILRQGITRIRGCRSKNLVGVCARRVHCSFFSLSLEHSHYWASSCSIVQKTVFKRSDCKFAMSRSYFLQLSWLFMVQMDDHVPINISKMHKWRYTSTTISWCLAKRVQCVLEWLI